MCSDLEQAGTEGGCSKGLAKQLKGGNSGVVCTGRLGVGKGGDRPLRCLYGWIKRTKVACLER